MVSNHRAASSPAGFLKMTIWRKKFLCPLSKFSEIVGIGWVCGGGCGLSSNIFTFKKEKIKEQKS